MHRHRHRAALLAAGAAVALAVAGAALATVTARTARATTTIKVTEREYHITLSTSSVRAGSVTFSIHNVGKIAHTLDLAGAGLSRTIGTPEIAPGKTRTLTVKLTGGKLSVWCRLPGHAALGMKTSLKVSGGTSSSGGSAGGSTTPAQTTTGYNWG